MNRTVAPYPAGVADRNQWIVERRPARDQLDPERPGAFFVEPELSADGVVREVATIFLTNRECPWKCVMCDLWQHTMEVASPPGSIVRQIKHALAQLPHVPVLKLYNSGSFFDPRAIPKAELPDIAMLCGRFQEVIVECHPALVGPGTVEFARQLRGRLQVALGLETAHPEALERINKRITVQSFEVAAGFLRVNGISVRTFLLVHPPFIEASAQKRWLQQSIRTAFDAGSSVVSLIPTRNGNGAMEDLRALGLFEGPALRDVEDGLAFGIGLNQGRVFGDTWDLSRFARCPTCAQARVARVRRMNLEQKLLPRLECSECHGA